MSQNNLRWKCDILLSHTLRHQTIRDHPNWDMNHFLFLSMPNVYSTLKYEWRTISEQFCSYKCHIKGPLVYLFDLVRKMRIKCDFSCLNICLEKNLLSNQMPYSDVEVLLGLEGGGLESWFSHLTVWHFVSCLVKRGDSDPLPTEDCQIGHTAHTGAKIQLLSKNPSCRILVSRSFNTFRVLVHRVWIQNLSISEL